MKKLFAILMALVLMLSMAACGGMPAETTAPPETTAPNETTTPVETTAPGTPAVQELDLEAVYQNILTAIDGGEEIVLFPEGSPDIIGAFYEGLNEVELKQQVYYIHPITGFACEVMLVEVADESDVQKVIDIFQSRITLGGNDEFYAETAAMWKSNAQVQSSGCYVCMIAMPEGCEIPADVFAN